MIGIRSKRLLSLESKEEIQAKKVIVVGDGPIALAQAIYLKNNSKKSF